MTNWKNICQLANYKCNQNRQIKSDKLDNYIFL